MFFVTESCLTWKCDLQLIDRGGRDDARGHVAGTTRHPAHMNESCRMRVSHVACEWVTSHANESCLMRRVMYNWYAQVVRMMREAKLQVTRGIPLMQPLLPTTATDQRTLH